MGLCVCCGDPGLYDGVVVDSGDGVTHIVCVVDGTVPMNLCQRLDIAGRHVTDNLLSLMLARGYAAAHAPVLTPLPPGQGCRCSRPA